MATGADRGRLNVTRPSNTMDRTISSASTCTVLKPAVNGGACITAPDGAAVVEAAATTGSAPGDAVHAVAA